MNSTQSNSGGAYVHVARYVLDSVLSKALKKRATRRWERKKKKEKNSSTGISSRRVATLRGHWSENGAHVAVHTALNCDKLE